MLGPWPIDTGVSTSRSPLDREGWVVFGSTSNWSISTSGPWPSDYNARFYWYPTRYNFETWILSPVIDLTGCSAVDMDFGSASNDAPSRPWLSMTQNEWTSTFPLARLRNRNLVSRYRCFTASSRSMNSPLMHLHMKWYEDPAGRMYFRGALIAI